MGDPRARQAALNASSRDQWAGFAGHRRRVSGLLSRDGGGRLGVLGAGNCHDLDLPALLAAYRGVCLVDLDADALTRGVADQGVSGHPALRTIGGIDLTGRLDAIASWSRVSAPGPDDLAALADAPARLVAPALPGPFETVASTCLLRPLIANAYHAVGDAHPRFPALVAALRAGHLRLLTRLAAPGGRAVLITDLASSDIVPGLAELPESALPELLPQLSRAGRFFHGVDPAILATQATRDPVVAARVAGQEASAPWRWRLHDRTYLVWALTYRIAP